jgi:hypothetical protein
VVAQPDTSNTATPFVTAHFACEHLASIGAAAARSDASILALTAILIAMSGYLAPRANLRLGIDVKTISLLLVIASFTYALIALQKGAFPRPPRMTRSLLNIRVIADRTPQQFRDAYLSANEMTFVEDITQQIHDRAQLLAVKQNELQKAYLATLIAIPPWLVALGILS